MPVQEGPGFLIALKISSGPSAGSGGGSLYSGRRIPSSQVKNLLRVPQQRAPAHCMSPSLACSSCFSPPTESGGLHVAPASISECSMAQKSLDCGSWGNSVMWLSYFSGPPKCCHIQPHQSIFCAHARLLSLLPPLPLLQHQDHLRAAKCRSRGCPLRFRHYFCIFVGQGCCLGHLCFPVGWPAPGTVEGLGRVSGWQAAWLELPLDC